MRSSLFSLAGILTFLVIISACQSSQSTTEANNELKLMTLMTGSFNSAQQAERDTTYFNISLHMYPIWTEGEGNWLYVEQALASTQDQPYRQRVYHIEQQEDGSVKSAVYTLKNQEDFIGKWQEASYFDQFSPDSLLVERTGCAVFMVPQDDGSFQGSTQGKDCASTIRGASYATSKVNIEKGKVTSWDQGFNSTDEQVWGATAGAYVFDKLAQ